MMKKINSKKELDEYIMELRETPYAPNKLTWEGTTFVCYNGSLYDIGDYPTGHFQQDYFHKDFFFPLDVNGIYRISFDFRVRDRGKYNPREADTWTRIEKLHPDVYSTDFEMVTKMTKIIFTKRDQEMYVLMDEEALIESGFIKGTVNSSYWFYKSEIKHLDTMLPYRKFDNTYRNVDLKQFRINDFESPEKTAKKKAEAFKSNIKFGTDSLTYKVFEGIQNTFGIEIETCIGRLDSKDYENLNLKAVHDGSLRDANGETPGGEYVTGVLKGDAGLAQLYEICRVLSSKCKVNQQCGVHVHVGSLNWNKDDVVYAYILGELLEKELFSILPASRRQNSYCRSLTALTQKNIVELAKVNSKSEYNILIDKMFNDIFSEVTNVKGRSLEYATERSDISSEQSLLTSKKFNRQQNHPLGSKCGYHKEAQRYCWLNFVTLLYNTKGSMDACTLEFRSHGATMNYTKIKNWTKICFAFCKFVEQHKALINQGQVDLATVIYRIYPKTGDELMKYINERKQLFNIKDESVDYIDTIPAKKSMKEVVCA